MAAKNGFVDVVNLLLKIGGAEVDKVAGWVSFFDFLSIFYNLLDNTR